MKPTKNGCKAVQGSREGGQPHPAQTPTRSERAKPARKGDAIVPSAYEKTSPQCFTPLEPVIGSIMKGLIWFFKKTILEQSRKRGAIPRCPGSVALRAGAALSLCDTGLSPALGVSVGRRHPGAQCQPQRAPGFPKARKVGNHASATPTERGEDEGCCKGKGGCSAGKGGPVSWMLSG